MKNQLQKKYWPKLSFRASDWSQITKFYYFFMIFSSGFESSIITKVIVIDSTQITEWYYSIV